jgi:hypothetical protein
MGDRFPDRYVFCEKCALERLNQYIKEFKQALKKPSNPSYIKTDEEWAYKDIKQKIIDKYKNGGI